MHIRDGAAAPGDRPPLAEWIGGVLATRGAAVALAYVDGTGLALCPTDGSEPSIVVTAEPHAVVAELDSRLRPRWIWWDDDTAAALLRHGVRVATCWDLAAVHRLLFGGYRTDPGRIWAALHELDEGTMPTIGQLDLLGPVQGSGGDEDDPVQPDGHLRSEWITGGWRRDEERWRRWASVIAEAGRRQRDRLSRADTDGATTRRRLDTARSESAAELLCAELGVDGLPVDRGRAEAVIATFAGRRPRDAADAAAIRRQRDAEVLRHLPSAADVDLRSPAQVRAMLAAIGIDLPDTRSWRLEAFRGAHPAVDALLLWRRAERFATTYGYDWMDRQLGADGRLRGSWTGCDGGAGRMTATAGLHSMPAELREAVVAEPGHVLVRADLGQIEPRVLAAVSGDPALAAATRDNDLYAPVAARLGVARAVAKVAVLAAMYGQTSGTAGEALRGLRRAYPVAMGFLDRAYEAGRTGEDVRTSGGRLVRMWPTPPGLDEEAARGNAAARGRYARNAVIQGAAAELFKAWAVTVRTRCASAGGRIVLCLHDELLVQVPSAERDAGAERVRQCLDEAARRWAPEGSTVRFVAEVSVVERWSDAKG